MSAKVNMEALPKEPDRAPSSSTPSEAVLICGSDGVARKARPQPHTTTALLLPGEPTKSTYKDMVWLFIRAESSSSLLKCIYNGWIISIIPWAKSENVAHPFDPVPQPAGFILTAHWILWYFLFMGQEFQDFWSCYVCKMSHFTDQTISGIIDKVIITLIKMLVAAPTLI